MKRCSMCGRKNRIQWGFPHVHVHLPHIAWGLPHVHLHLPHKRDESNVKSDDSKELEALMQAINSNENGATMKNRIQWGFPHVHVHLPHIAWGLPHVHLHLPHKRDESNVKSDDAKSLEALMQAIDSKEYGETMDAFPPGLKDRIQWGFHIHPYHKRDEHKSDEFQAEDDATSFRPRPAGKA
ncbi:uncharacterized protein LOC119734572 [Patiria miniata]|uniref:Uncharacterized protein n=1 Tax=Patiria miniata TaxID=46514 RepID=A0A914AJX9_PATMI|nr:uncharacterized protein LOC119734572 [Patiria miniata]